MYATLAGRAGMGLIGLAMLAVAVLSFYWQHYAKLGLLEFALQVMVFAYAGLLGVSLAPIFVAYTGSSIAGAFFATAAGFAGLSLYGYTTQRNLSALGAFMIVGLVGIIVAMIVNMFLASGPLGLVISVLGVLIFAGLTAWDTQRTKSIYSMVAGTEAEGRAKIMSALNLYLDFINMFLFILRLFGSSRN